MAVDPKNVDPLECLKDGPDCPVEASIYGYYPSMEANAFFVALFAFCFFGSTLVGFRYKTWTYMTAICLAALCSAIGYAGRISLHNNPYDKIGFQIQICCLTLSPAFNSAAMYLMLKHIVRHFGREWSRLRPKHYTWGFITADFLALVLQAAGGGLAATAEGKMSQLELGDHLMMAGICWQVATLVIFGTMVMDFLLRRFVFSGSQTALSPAAQKTASQAKFKLFTVALTISYFAILIRCVYRIAEMSQGWRNPIMQNEPLFIGLDSTLVAMATVLQTFVHPGFCFKAFTGTEIYLDEKRISSESSIERV